jgi:hypothetical protein
MGKRERPCRSGRVSLRAVPVSRLRPPIVGLRCWTHDRTSRQQMPRQLTQYRIFIGSPGGLEEERRLFRETLIEYTASDAEPRGVTLHPVGWEDTLGGVGRPQELINEDLRQCDYAVFVLHDRWGSPTGSAHFSGTEEEWAIAEKRYAAAKLRNIVIFFKHVDERQIADAGTQLQKVIDFKKSLIMGRKYLFKQYREPEEFSKQLQKHLARWLLDHEKSRTDSASKELAEPSRAGSSIPALVGPSSPPPDFPYWIAEAERVQSGADGDREAYSIVLFCARKALKAAVGDAEWAEAQRHIG